MRCFLCLFLLAFSLFAFADQNKTTPNDGDWSKQLETLSNTAEAEWMIRVGDIDNLGFGWPEGFIPFSGKSTPPHPFPWKAKPDDAKGTDRIMVPSSFKAQPWSSKCGGDGYSGTERPDNLPVPIVIPLDSIKTADIKSVSLQLFVDDFQSPVICSKFQVKINGARFIEMEKILETLQQTGPIGKIINVKLPDEMLDLLKGESLSVLIDDPTTGAADGFAIDFVKLLINPKSAPYRGSILGLVIDKTTRQPIKGATAEVKDYGNASTGQDGRFTIGDIPAGVSVVSASAPGYSSAQAQVDVVADEKSQEVLLELPKSTTVTFNNQTMQEGDTLVLNNIQFDVNSATLRDVGKQELDKLAAFMQQHPTVEILLSGHTSSEGTPEHNKTLSMDRVKSCKAYLISKSIDEGRIEVIGYGSEKPVAPNDTEANRAKNRRVEMKITKL